MDSKYCPLYIHFNAEHLKEYAQCIQNVHNEAFPFSELRLEKTHMPD